MLRLDFYKWFIQWMKNTIQKLIPIFFLAGRSHASHIYIFGRLGGKRQSVPNSDPSWVLDMWSWSCDHTSKTQDRHQISHVIVPRLTVFQLYRCFHATLRAAIHFLNLYPWICEWNYVSSFAYFILFVTVIMYHIITPYLYLKPTKRSILVPPQK